MDKSSEPPTRSITIKVWDLPLRLFHWLLVGMIVIAFLSSEEGSELASWHVPVGWGIVILLAFRLTWGMVGGEHARFAKFVRLTALSKHIWNLLHRRTEATLGHNPLGAISVLTLLGLIAATVWTGAVGADEEIHELLAYTLLGLIAMHICAVVIMSFLTDENLVHAMITGRKRRDRHPGAEDARPAKGIAFLLTVLTVAAAAAAILSYDPHAFSQREREPEADLVENGTLTHFDGY